jgi:ketosteroid isomerase-like protein
MDSPDMEGATAVFARPEEIEAPRGHASVWGADGERIYDFLARWDEALNSHDLDELDALLCEDVVWVDPAMFGETVHGRAEVRAFHETLLHGFPDIRFQSVSSPNATLEGDGVAQRWRMTGTFTGDHARGSSRECNGDGPQVHGHADDPVPAGQRR